MTCLIEFLDTVKLGVHGETFVSETMKDFMVSPFHRVRGHEISYETVFHATKVSVSSNGSFPHLISCFILLIGYGNLSGAHTHHFNAALARALVKFG